MKKLIFTNLLFLFTLVVNAQESAPYNGVKDNYEPVYAFKNATIYVDAQTKIENATLVIQGGKILQVGKAIIIKKGAIIKDCKGLTIYPSFIDSYSSYGIKSSARKKWSPRPQISSSKKGAYYWNEAVKPESQASQEYTFDEKERQNLMKAGFGLVNSHIEDGVVRGTSIITSLTSDVKKGTIKNNATQHFSLKKGTSRQSYPSSQMGSIALLKQFYADATWYADSDKSDNLSLDAHNQNNALPSVFETTDKLEIMRVDKIGDALNIQYIFKGSGNEYQRLDAIKATNAPLIIPINFPKGIKINDPYDIDHIPLSELKHWELAPSNLKFLSDSDIQFAITSSDLKDKKAFLPNLRKAIKAGLSIENAINALTIYPATLLGIQKNFGKLKEGMSANFIITSKNLFHDNDSKILENWTLGVKNEIEAVDVDELTGSYDLMFNQKTYPLNIKKTGKTYRGSIEYITEIKDSILLTTKIDTIKAPVTIQSTRKQISLSFIMKNNLEQGIVYLGGTFEPKFGIMDGDGIDSKGQVLIWSGVKSGSTKSKKKGSNPYELDTLSMDQIWYPNMAYGFDSIPEAATYIIRNATIWSNEASGIMKNADLMIQDGKITKVGTISGSIPKNTVIIDAKGKHVTSGIIDEHSHIAISKGVNESGQSVTAEVSIGDVVNSYDIDIYRQLAGGVTTSQLLHGSANPIGGQAALIKLKWGSEPADLLYPNAPKFIKFALGENVKQTNWGDFNTVRFPQTRMGVEQVFYHSFKKAKAYAENKKAYEELSDKKKLKQIKPLVDYELEVLNEILDSKRFVTCHSYIQSEINMLMKVADSMGFTLNTFTHILEGYKVADKMKAHGAGGSTFADWWAYKFEVNDAIPYNATILNDLGIVTAINSDDAEMARRLNQEAGKIVKYGQTSQEDAWKMVTLNPAKLLHIDDKVGSIKVGKDADIVIWSDNPLSINAITEKTFVDGVLLFDIDQQQELIKRNQLEKSRILLKMSSDKGQKKEFKPKKKGHYHCDTIEQL